jgi:uncharacterized protein YjbI with pentapeptide repeats
MARQAVRSAAAAVCWLVSRRAVWCLLVLGVFVGLLVLAIAVMPPIVVGPAPSSLSEADRLNRLRALNDVRSTLVTALGGLVVLVGAISGAFFTAQTIHVNREGQITDRFTKAIVQLADEKLDVRLGGIYALERIARDSEKDHGPIMEVLTAFLRERARWTPDPVTRKSSNTSPGPSSVREQQPRAPVDVQAIATVLARRPDKRRRQEQQPLDLRHVDLQAAHLPGAHFEGASLSYANLEKADLRAARLEGVDLKGATLRQAVLSAADLRGANLSGAHLYEVDLGGADLKGADLSFAKLYDSSLNDADMRNANLAGAELFWADCNNSHLEASDLRRASLEETNLSNAHLEGADLRGACLKGASLRNANLEGANLGAKSPYDIPDELLAASGMEVNPSYARLEGADFYGAGLRNADLRNADLSRTQGLTRAQLKTAITGHTTIWPVEDYSAPESDAGEPA